MAASHQILRSTVYLAVSRIAGDLAYVVFYVCFSRAFGRSGVGLYAFVLELSGVLFLIADYGLSQYMVREISRRKDQLLPYLGTFMVFKGCSTLVMLGVLAGVAPLFHLDARGTQVLLAVGLAQACYTFAELFRSAFAAHERLPEIAWADFLYKCGIAVFGLLLLALRRPFEEVVWAFPISGVIYLLSLLAAVRMRLGRPVLRVESAIIRQAAAHSLNFFLFAVCIDLYPSLTVILLKWFKGEDACGIFAVPQKMMAMLIVVFMFYRMALFPNLSRLSHESKSAHRQLYVAALKYLTMLMVPMAALLFLTADKLILASFGSEFEPSIPVFRVFCVYLLFVAVKYLLAAVLGSIDEQGALVRAHGIGLVLHIAAVLLLVPRWSALGGAVALTVAEGAVCVMTYRVALRRLGGLPWRHMLARPLLASASMGLLVVLLRHLSILIVLPAAAVTALTCLVLSGAIRKDDVLFVRRALGWEAVGLVE